MEQWRKDARKEPIIIDIDSLVPADHLLRKIEKVMDYEWIYERLDPYYNHNNGRPGTDPVVLIKMVLIQHLFGIPSLRQTQGTPLPTGMANAYTEALRRNAETVPAGHCAERTKRGRKFSQPIFGRSIWIWWSRSERRSVRRRFMHNAKKPLSGSLRMRKRNMP